jgi:hypothetical protein
MQFLFIIICWDLKWTLFSMLIHLTCSISVYCAFIFFIFFILSLCDIMGNLSLWFYTTFLGFSILISLLFQVSVVCDY